MRRLAMLIAVVVLVAPARAEDAVKKEMAQLDGDWSMVSGQANGIPLPKDLVAGDPTKKPKAIDYMMTEGPTKGKTHLGIYELDGDTVKFCFAAPDE